MNNIATLFKIAILAFTVFGFSSCQDFLTPDGESRKYDDAILWSHPKIAEGILLNAYGKLPTDYVDNEEYGADDAVTNKLDHAMITAATGAWSARSNPLDSYENNYSALLNLNLFLENVDKVMWDNVSQANDSLYKKRLKGEAYGLRAYFEYVLLRNVGGKSSSGDLLGFPIVTSSVLTGAAAQPPRNTYAECVKQIFADCDSAVKLLPMRWTDTGLKSNEKEIFGAQYQNRINGITVKLIKTRTALMAASEAFKASGITMQQTAELAAEIIKINGFDKLQNKDVQFYTQARTADLSYFADKSEVFWYSSIVAKSTTREANFYPPSLYGKGLINPSQNLVDAFADMNGYPINHSATVYNSARPYIKRDTRLNKYIFYNGSVTEKSVVLNIKDSEKDPVGKTTNSTRTGYYLRKLLDENVILTPGLITSTPHYLVYARYTEALLAFAEAANQAVGPDGNIGGFTARDVVNRIRKRAGITSTAYVASLDKVGLEQLIRNERRVELCFEGFRFWDLRRWNDLTAMNESMKGIDLQLNTAIEVEQRKYEPYMIYGPIPYSETLKYNIQQNAGWE